MDNLVCQKHITTDTFKRGETRFSSHFWISNELNEDIDLKKKKKFLGCYNWYKVSEIRPGSKSRKLLKRSCTMTCLAPGAFVTN